MGNHGSPSTFWEFMAQHGVSGATPTQELVSQMAYMGEICENPPISTQDIEIAQILKKFQKFPAKRAFNGKPHLKTCENPPFTDESRVFSLKLIREPQASPMISHIVA